MENDESDTKIGIKNNRRFPRVSFGTIIKNTKFIVVFVICLSALIGIGLPSVLQRLRWVNVKPIQYECQLPANFRLECLPGRLLTAYTSKNCEELGCCWDNTTSLKIPWCFHSFPSSYHYIVEEGPRRDCNNSYFKDTNNANMGDVEKLVLQATPGVKDQILPVLGSKAFPITVEAHYINDHRLMVKMFESNARRFEPDMFLRYSGQGAFRDYVTTISNQTNYVYNADGATQKERCSDGSNRKYIIETAKKREHFYLNIKRRNETERSIFRTDFGAFIFSAQFIEFTAVLPSTNIYGLGQGDRSSLLHEMKEGRTWSFFNRSPKQDINTDLSNGTLYTKGWYGSHPFYLCIEKDGMAHGVLFGHTNIMEATLTSVPAITIRSMGPSMTFHVFMGPTPADVIRQLTSVVGKPVFPPYWALGHHVCRSFDINHITEYDEVRASVKDLKMARIPQESDCVFQNNRDFPWELNRFEWEKTVQELEEHGIRLTLVHSPQIENKNINFSLGDFVKYSDGKPYTGVRNGKSMAYLNFFHNATAPDYIKHELISIFKKTAKQFGGYFLNDNVPTIENDNKCPPNIANDPPFVPGTSDRFDLRNQTMKSQLINETICFDACHAERCTPVPLKPDENNLRQNYHYNLHNLYGHGHAETMYRVLQEQQPTQRPFIVSLSTFTGTGRYGGHWNGEIISSWHALKRSLIQMLEFGLYGIPLTGSPACGFTGEVNRDLCSRWAQLSAFQPLALSYRKIEKSTEKSTENAKEPFSTHPFLQDELVTSVAAASMQLRYSLLPYLYTVFRLSSITGDPVARPLFYEFPKDPTTYDIDDQFLWGSSLLISPVLRPATTRLKPYFPPGTWYDFYDGTLIYQGEPGGWVEVSAIEYHVNLHIRGGHILSSQKANIRTDLARREPFKIQVAIEQTGNKKENETAAKGQLYIDDGDGINERFFMVNMEASRVQLKLTPSDGVSDFRNINDTDYSLTLDKVYVLGLKKPYNDCRLETLDLDKANSTVPCHYDSLQGILSFRNLSLDLRYEAVLTWKVSLI